MHRAARLSPLLETGRCCAPRSPLRSLEVLDTICRDVFVSDCLGVSSMLRPSRPFLPLPPSPEVAAAVAGSVARFESCLDKLRRVQIRSAVAVRMLRFAPKPPAGSELLSARSEMLHAAAPIDCPATVMPYKRGSPWADWLAQAYTSYDQNDCAGWRLERLYKRPQ